MMILVIGLWIFFLPFLVLLTGDVRVPLVMNGWVHHISNRRFIIELNDPDSGICTSSRHLKQNENLHFWFPQTCCCLRVRDWMMNSRDKQYFYEPSWRDWDLQSLRFHIQAGDTNYICEIPNYSQRIIHIKLLVVLLTFSLWFPLLLVKVLLFYRTLGSSARVFLNRNDSYFSKIALSTIIFTYTTINNRSVNGNSFLASYLIIRKNMFTPRLTAGNVLDLTFHNFVFDIVFHALRQFLVNWFPRNDSMM